MKKYIIIIFYALLALHITACEDTLVEEVYSELTPTTFLNTENGMLSLLNSAYAHAQLMSFQGHLAFHYLSAMTTGEAWSQGGSIEVWWTALTEFGWDSNHQYVLGTWTDTYAGIRDANIVLDNIDNENFSADFQKLSIAEARFIRAWSYVLLYNLFGPVPLYNSSSSSSEVLPRATDEEMKSFIELELSEVLPDLPLAAAATGRATRGATMGILCKHYMNTKQWQKAADMAQDIIDLNVYDLVPNYADVFSLANEANEELLWFLPRVAPTAVQFLNALTFPTDYPLPPNNAVWGAKTYLFDDFVNSFEAGDTRKDLIVTEYVNTSDELITLLGTDKSLSLKYEFDPNAAGPGGGNDIPAIRYADILLSRAEALNELSGPTQEAIDLINEVRERANASLLLLSGFTQESLREHILNEREWEFYMEGKKREDQLRQGTFISDAQARGKSAQSHHVLFAIPQVDIDASKSIIEQNPGY